MIAKGRDTPIESHNRFATQNCPMSREQDYNAAALQVNKDTTRAQATKFS